MGLGTDGVQTFLLSKPCTLCDAQTVQSARTHNLEIWNLTRCHCANKPGLSCFQPMLINSCHCSSWQENSQLGIWGLRACWAPFLRFMLPVLC